MAIDTIGRVKSLKITLLGANDSSAGSPIDIGMVDNIDWRNGAETTEYSPNESLFVDGFVSQRVTELTFTTRDQSMNGFKEGQRVSVVVEQKAPVVSSDGLLANAKIRTRSILPGLITNLKPTGAGSDQNPESISVTIKAVRKLDNTDPEIEDTIG